MNSSGRHDEPVRVARIITRLNIGGPSIQAVELSARLEGRGYHTRLLHGRVGAAEGDMSYLVPADRAFETAPIGSLRREIAPASDAAAVGAVLRELRRFRPHIVHTHMAKAGSVGRVAAAIYNATNPRARRVRVVHTYHGHVLDGYFSTTAAAAFAFVERTLARKSDALIAVSRNVRQDLLEAHRIGSPDRFHVVPLGFNLSTLSAIGDEARARARTALGIEPGARVVSFVGRLTGIKQPALFLEAAVRIASEDPRARFLVAGGGELEPSLRAAASALGPSVRVTFLGWRRDVETIYAASDVVALTSRNEGTPVAVIEAMAAAVPAAAFAVGGVPDVIVGTDVGVLVAPGDVDALAASIGALLRDDQRRSRMGAAARQSVSDRFGIDRLVGDIDRLYRQLL